MVTKRNGVWTVDVRMDMPNGSQRRVRRISPVQTKRGALEYERYLHETWNAKALDEGVERREFAEFAVAWLNQHVRVHHKPSTICAYESAMAVHLIPEFGEFRLAEITGGKIAAFQARLLQGRAPKTVTNIVRVLTSALTTAVSWGELDAVPEVKTPKRRGPTVTRFLSYAECRELDDAATPYWADMITVARTSGLRLGELCALSWPQVDFDRGVLKVDRAVWRKHVTLPKHDRVRAVELPPSTLELLRSRRRQAGTALVFPTLGGTMRQERTCDTGLRRCARRAGIKPFGWHTLRHTYASHLAMRGVPIIVVKELLGHSDIQTTMRYAHVSPAARTKSVALLDGPPEGVAQVVG